MSWPFWGVQLFAIAGVIYSGWSWAGFGLAVALYYARMLFVCTGYHRYFSHRTFKTSRPVQFLFALLATTSAQKGVLWWAGHHRRHHKYSDKAGDVHSAKLDGFWWSHVGWVVSDSAEQDELDKDRVRDLYKFPELRALEKVNLLPAVLLAVILALVGGWHALLWGFFVSTTLLWHGTFLVNSLNHVVGRRRYDTEDESKNCWWIALFTLGEGWHNNHHHYMASANQGFRWYEYDPAFYFLRLLAALGIIWDLRTAPAHVVNQTRDHVVRKPNAAAQAPRRVLPSTEKLVESAGQVVARARPPQPSAELPME